MKRSVSKSLTAIRSRQTMAQPLWVIGLIFVILLSACRPVSQNGIRRTPGTPTATPRESPTPAPTFTPAPVRLDPFIALCLIKPKVAATLVNFYAEPDENATLIRKLRNREVLTVTMRSLDESWVHGSTKDLKEGWVQSPDVACTVPIHELYVSPNTGTVADVTATAMVASTATAVAVGTPTLTPEAAASTDTPTPTLIPATDTPAATPTLPVSTDTPTPAITPTTPTLAEILCSVTITSGLNVRIGPATSYRAFVKLSKDETFTAIGRNADNTWLAGRTAEGRPGWIYAASVRCIAPTTQLSVLGEDAILRQITPTPGPDSAQPTATEAPPTPSPTAAASPTLTATTIVTLEATATSKALTLTRTATPTANAALTITLTPTTSVQPTRTSPGLNCTVGVSTGVYLRTGPARTFPALGIAGRGEPYVALARSANNTWVFGRSKAGIVGWSIAGGVRCPAQFRSLPISRQLLPTPTPKP